jgi:excisionase family DNA binding protein
MKIYKITEASDYLGVSINTLKTLANNGKIKSFKTTGEHRRFRQEDLDAYMGVEKAWALTTVGDVLKMLENDAKEYRKDALASIRRNSHMNKATGADIDQRDIDALLVDFVNFFASRRCVDYGLYTKHLDE